MCVAGCGTWKAGHTNIFIQTDDKLMAGSEGTSQRRKKRTRESSNDHKDRKKANGGRGSKDKKGEDYGLNKRVKSNKKVKREISKEQKRKWHETVDEEPRPERERWSKSKKKRMRQIRSKMKNKASEEQTTAQAAKKVPTKDPDSEPSKNDRGGEKIAKDIPSAEKEATRDVLVTNKGASCLQKSYAARLSGSRFRILNEELYTTTSSTAFEKFQSNPDLFDQYHEGFRHQVEQWPSNPVEEMFNWLCKRYSTSSKTTAVADFGCGDAELARRLLTVPSLVPKKKGKNGNKSVHAFKVHSFDLVAKSNLVTACDMANVPLDDKSVDVAVFCLALMGTNVTDFLVEAHRVLKDKGKVKIAEVRSRFESTSGKDDLSEFVAKLEQLGFDCTKVDRSNKMFIMMELRKNSKKPDRKLDVKIKPCIYKRR